MAEHALFSASAADRWMECPGSLALSDGLAGTTSKYAAEGTVAHQVLSRALAEGVAAETFRGDQIDVDGFVFEVDDEMIGHVQTTLDYITDIRGADGAVMHDLRVNYAAALGVETDLAWGTLDVMVLRGTELIVVDFKYGQGVLVSAERNRQIMLYALGALAEYGDLADIETVRLVIHQPRIDKRPSEDTLTVAELLEWARTEAAERATASLRAIAGRTTADDPSWAELHLRPGEKQCRFCPAKAICPALREDIMTTVIWHSPATADEFAAATVSSAVVVASTTADWLAACLSRVDMIEDWCKAVRAESERRLLAGEALPGWKLVQGKQGSRAWSDAKQAEHMLRKVFRLPIEDAYYLKVISPTSAEKLAIAGKIGPRQWSKLTSLISRTAGKPHVAPEADSRPALDVTPASADFQPVADGDML
jgi:hypothetical protein